MNAWSICTAFNLLLDVHLPSTKRSEMIFTLINEDTVKWSHERHLSIHCLKRLTLICIRYTFTLYNNPCSKSAASSTIMESFLTFFRFEIDMALWIHEGFIFSQRWNSNLPRRMLGYRSVRRLHGRAPTSGNGSAGPPEAQKRRWHSDRCKFSG